MSYIGARRRERAGCSAPVDRGNRGQRALSSTDAPTASTAAPATLRNRLAAAALESVVRGIQVLPRAVAYGLADLLAPLLALSARLHDRWLRDERNTRKARKTLRGTVHNQRIVYREALTPERGRRLLRDWARHILRLVVELARLPNIDRENLERYADVSDLDTIRPIVKDGAGLICVTGHIGAWEMCGHLASLCGITVTVVSRPVSNPLVQDLVTRIRTSGGQKVLSKWGVVWSLKKALDRGEVLGLVADENTRERPIFAPFLGTMAATISTPAALHRSTGVPIAVVTCHRVAPERFELRVWDIIRHPKTDDRDADLLAITHRMNDALSRAILHAPDQWFWGSRRFVTRPPGEQLGPDGLPPRAHDLDRYGDHGSLSSGRGGA